MSGESTMDAIKNALSRIDENVFYGTASGLPNDARWDYIVFSREKTSMAENGSGFVDAYNIAVVREEYVDEGLFGQVVDAMRSIPGMRLSSDDTQYLYDVSKTSGRVVEMMVMPFIKARKR